MSEYMKNNNENPVWNLILNGPEFVWIVYEKQVNAVLILHEI